MHWYNIVTGQYVVQRYRDRTSTKSTHASCSQCGQEEVYKRYVNLTKNKLDKISSLMTMYKRITLYLIFPPLVFVGNVMAV